MSKYDLNSIKFYKLNAVHPQAINGKVVGTYFLPKEFEGEPTAWIIPEGMGYVVKTNMSKWVTVKILYQTLDNGERVFFDQKSTEAIDIASGSFEACEAAIRLYNM